VPLSTWDEPARASKRRTPIADVYGRKGDDSDPGG
jgi:hypothetical protein